MHIKHGSWKTHQTVDSYEPVSSKLPEKKWAFNSLLVSICVLSVIMICNWKIKIDITTQSWMNVPW